MSVNRIVTNNNQNIMPNQRMASLSTNDTTSEIASNPLTANISQKRVNTNNTSNRNIPNAEINNLYKNLTYVNHTDIPSIFHTSCCKEGDPKMHQLMNKLKRSIQVLTYDMNNVYFNVHSMNDIDTFMKKYFPSYYPSFNEKLKVIEKIDIFRYLVVYKFGGWWSDADITLEYVPNHWFQIYGGIEYNNIGCIFGIQQAHTIFIHNFACYDCSYYDFVQWFFGCKKGHKVLKMMVDLSFKKWNNANIGVLEKTGPDLVTEAINKYAKEYGYSKHDIADKIKKYPYFKINDILILSNCAFSSNNWGQTERWCRQYPDFDLKPLVLHHYHGSWRH